MAQFEDENQKKSFITTTKNASIFTAKINSPKKRILLKAVFSWFLWTIINVCFYQCLLPIRKSCETMEGKTDISPFFLFLFIFFLVLYVCALFNSQNEKSIIENKFVPIF